MKLNHSTKALALTASILFATAPFAHSEPATENLAVHLNAETGFSSESNAATWTDQADLGGIQVFKGQYSAKPELASVATPSGKAAIRFNGATNNPNQLKLQDAESYQVAEGESLTWTLVLKPAELSAGNDTYIQTTLDGRNYAWSISQGKHGFVGEVRGTNGERYISLVPNAGLGEAATDWMILTAVYDGRAKIFQLFLTDKDGKSHAGNQVSSASLHSGAHKLTTLATNTDRNDGAGMDLAAVLIYKSALDEATRLALEKDLAANYFAVSN